MFESDEESRKVAGEMLYNCNYEKSLYYIYKLVKEDYYNMRQHIPNWNIIDAKLDMPKLRNLETRDAFAYFFSKGLLTEEMYDDLITDIIVQANTQLNKNLESKFIKLVPARVKTYDEYIAENTPKEVPTQSEAPAVQTPF